MLTLHPARPRLLTQSTITAKHTGCNTVHVRCHA
jgi:hypothetical protein